ncbi:hypothetical protein Acsp03_55500 [Actinomadura sp. NBRC 104412]|nr:hypothetical protein Acsp03_55500 [Actinomadura sp. NBRC 104412]
MTVFIAPRKVSVGAAKDRRPTSAEVPGVWAGASAALDNPMYRGLCSVIILAAPRSGQSSGLAPVLAAPRRRRGRGRGLPHRSCGHLGVAAPSGGMPQGFRNRFRRLLEPARRALRNPPIPEIP